MIDDFCKFLLKEHIAPFRQSLVDQLVANTGDEKADHIRGQIRGLDRAKSAIEEAARRFDTEAAHG